MDIWYLLRDHKIVGAQNKKNPNKNCQESTLPRNMSEMSNIINVWKTFLHFINTYYTQIFFEIKEANILIG